tara:strand:- start:4902 stop:10616 length:5715 start_codon:yes stop_codon:yes gene_type:complete
MEENKINIVQVDPTTFEFQQYSEKDNNLISSSRLDTAFTSSTDYIEYYAYDESKNLIFPTVGSVRAAPVTNYNVINGDTLLYPDENLSDLGYDEGTFYATYNFYRKLIASDIENNYYISEISSDRTELRLNSNTIASELIISSSEEFIGFRETQEYFVDFLLNFGNDQQVIANNLKLDTTTAVEPSLLVKLYEPLPSQFELKSTLWVVGEISQPEAYSVTFPPFVFESNDIQFIKGPNYSITAIQETGESGQEFSYNTLISTDITSSQNQVKNLLNRKNINISVDYKEYSNFVHFSSAYTRLDNFYYKVGLIQSSSLSIEALPLNSGNYSSSKAELSNSIEKVISNLDGWEYFMYFNSGSVKSYPKQNTEPPYILFSTGSTEALTWVGSTDEESPYYGGQALSASNYDADNQDYLYNAIPEYLKDDPENAKYELFVDMVAQQYDNTWLYTKNLTTRFDADNRLDFGISKDLVADAIRDFGVKLYSNNFNTNDLYTAFLGITPSGSSFPFPNMTGSIGGLVNTPSGFQYVDTTISASNDIVPLDDVNKQLYKRIYHNIPLLLKKKGTIAGLRALITAYGIPSTILRINEFGGKDRNDFQDWDYSEDVFNYAFHSDGISNQITSSFQLSTGFAPVVTETKPKTLQFRFKTPGVPLTATPIHQNLWVGEDSSTPTAFITLDYTGSGMTSQSYSGSSPSESNAYGTLTFYPDGNNGLTKTASIDLPFFDGGWWSVMATIDYTSNKIPAYLYSANRIGDKIGHSGSDNVIHNWQYFDLVTTSSFPNTENVSINGEVAAPFSGAYQEIRYWDVQLSESLFYDYVVNPYSTQGNTINSTPQDLAFRADLGTQLITSSRKSIHPRITGSWDITQSFSSGNSEFYVTGSFIQNTESIFLNQVPGGIKNRISDQVKIVQEVLPSGSTLSPYRSIQQDIYPSGSNPSINYLEVAFSPTDQVNDDIVAQIGAFNLGDYIGDPRQVSESGYSYPQLDALRDAYFTKYINSYDINDFIRLISFFDNSLFKMIKDFTPARTSLSSGVVIKQNLLERNRQAPPSMSFTLPEYSGSVKSFPRDYQVPNSSSSFPAYGNVSGSAIYKFSGGTGGVFEPFNNNFAAPVSQSAQDTCLLGYFYNTSSDLLEVNDTFGESVFTTNIDNNPTTMSLNLRGESGINNFNFLQTLSTSSINQDNFLYYSALSGQDRMKYKIDEIQFGGGYGGFESDYGTALYGTNYSSSVFFKLTVITNSGFVPVNNQGVEICFEINGSPYSGLTESEVSASEFYAQYPEFVQQWSESIVPSLGITPPYHQEQTGSNQLPPVNYPRIDQREFYNGEFGNAIQVGANEICKTFFGQDAIIDYFFRIQWFNHISKNEEDFILPNFIPTAGNVWFWADTVNQNGTLTQNKSLNVTQNFQTPNYPSNTTVTTTNFTTDGNGANAEFKIQTFSNPASRGYPLSITSTNSINSGFTPGDTITISVAELVSLGYTTATQDLIVTLLTQDVAYNVTNKVKYIKMSNVDVNGEKIQPYIIDSDYVIFNLTGASDYLNRLIEGYQSYFISNTSLQNDQVPGTEDATLLIINQEPSSDAVNSFDDSFYNLTFSASGVFSYYATASGEDPNVIPATGFTESIAQGYFPPVPTYPTESFFKGWDQANYFQTTDTGGVVRVSTGDGFNSDTFGNFNTGSTEFDGDATNTLSEVPWFMNAKNDTYHALSASSTLTGGPASVTKLALYDGDITASAVPIGPAFNLYSPPSTITITPILQAVEGTTDVISLSCGNGPQEVDGANGSSNSSRQRTVLLEVNDNPNTEWVWYFETDLGNGFTRNFNPDVPSFLVNQSPFVPNPAESPSGNRYSGDAIVTIRANAGGPNPNDGTQESRRNWRIVFRNYDNEDNTIYCPFYQDGFFDGGVPGDDPQLNP